MPFFKCLSSQNKMLVVAVTFSESQNYHPSLLLSTFYVPVHKTCLNSIITSQQLFEFKISVTSIEI